MKAGKYVFIDIGCAETKIIEANVQQRCITLLKSAEMRDMSQFVSDTHTIKTIEGFCLSLKKTLDDAGIKTTSAIVSSSILDLATTNITQEFKTVKECQNKFEATYGRATNFSKIHDWQYAGEIIADKEITHRLLLTSGRLLLLKSLIEAMRSMVGLTVCEIESTFTAQLNLQILYASSFDLPSTVFMDFGKDSIYCKYFKSGTFVVDSTFKHDIQNLGEILSAKYDIAYPKFMNLLYNIGVVDTPDNRSKLVTEGINADTYFDDINTLVNSLSDDIKAQLVQTSRSKSLDNMRLIIAGGIMSIPGLADLFTSIYNFTPCSVIEIDTFMKNKQFKIVNKLNRVLAPKYANCIGSMLKIYNEYHTVNLVPKELMIVDSGKVAQKATFVLNVAAIATFIGIIGLNVFPVVDWVNKWDIPEKKDAAQQKYSLAMAQNNKLSKYIDNLNSINNSLTPFINFLHSCENTNLKIATVDTSNILNQAVVVVTPDSSKEPSKPDDTSVTTSSNPLKHVIVRGYGTTSDHVTGFYEKLSNNESVASVNMNGIREAKVSESETIYIFEFEVEVSENG